MTKFVPKKKMSKKARRKLAAEKRNTWDFSPVTRRIENKKAYNRKRISRTGYDDGQGGFSYPDSAISDQQTSIASRAPL